MLEPKPRSGGNPNVSPEAWERMMAVKTAFWVKYYNHKRPHKGIRGLCLADRFYETAYDLIKTLEKSVEENVLERSSQPGGGYRLFKSPWFYQRFRIFSKFQ